MKKRKNLIIGLYALMMILLVLGLSRTVRQSARAQEPQSADIPQRQPTNSEGPGQYGLEAVNPASPTELAQAMGVPNSDLTSASLMGSDKRGVGVSSGSLGNWFPTEGNSFAILATDLAADATLPNSSGSHSGFLDGLNNNLNTDLVRLQLALHVPSNVNCLNFDFAYYSEEFPEFVGSIFNDTFTAQLNNANLTVDSGTFVANAPGNFAFDTQNSVISVNTVFGVSENTGTTYDGSTPNLRASAKVTPDSNINVYLSVQDLGDSVWDSAVFIDRFFWSKDALCSGGASVDTDGDGLLDEWEENGLTIDGKAVDLPAMGADPEHKDIFVEIDWMGNPGDGHNHAPDPDAIQEIVDAFNNAPVSNPDSTNGIHLHVDYGPGSPLTWGAAATWGSLSEGNVVTIPLMYPHVEPAASVGVGSIPSRMLISRRNERRSFITTSGATACAALSPEPAASRETATTLPSEMEPAILSSASGSGRARTEPKMNKLAPLCMSSDIIWGFGMEVGITFYGSLIT